MQEKNKKTKRKEKIINEEEVQIKRIEERKKIYERQRSQSIKRKITQLDQVASGDWGCEGSAETTTQKKNMTADIGMNSAGKIIKSYVLSKPHSVKFS